MLLKRGHIPRCHHILGESCRKSCAEILHDNYYHCGNADTFVCVFTTGRDSESLRYAPDINGELFALDVCQECYR